MGRIPDLPCDIEQVVDLLGIEVISIPESISTVYFLF